MRPEGILPITPTPVNAYTAVKSLKITHLQASATVTATCTKGGKACPLRKPKTFTASPGSVDARTACP